MSITHDTHRVLEPIVHALAYMYPEPGSTHVEIPFGATYVLHVDIQARTIINTQYQSILIEFSSRSPPPRANLTEVPVPRWSHIQHLQRVLNAVVRILEGGRESLQPFLSSRGIGVRASLLYATYVLTLYVSAEQHPELDTQLLPGPHWRELPLGRPVRTHPEPVLYQDVNFMYVAVAAYGFPVRDVIPLHNWNLRDLANILLYTSMRAPLIRADHDYLNIALYHPVMGDHLGTLELSSAPDVHIQSVQITVRTGTRRYRWDWDDPRERERAERLAVVLVAAIQQMHQVDARARAPGHHYQLSPREVKYHFIWPWRDQEDTVPNARAARFFSGMTQLLRYAGFKFPYRDTYTLKQNFGLLTGLRAWLQQSLLQQIHHLLLSGFADPVQLGQFRVMTGVLPTFVFYAWYAHSFAGAENDRNPYMYWRETSSGLLRRLIAVRSIVREGPLQNPTLSIDMECDRKQLPDMEIAKLLRVMQDVVCGTPLFTAKFRLRLFPVIVPDNGDLRWSTQTMWFDAYDNERWSLIQQEIGEDNAWQYGRAANDRPVFQLECGTVERSMMHRTLDRFVVHPDLPALIARYLYQE